jgi:hypothetical protein
MTWPKRKRRRPALPGATTRAGLGGEHQRERRQALDALREGIDCCPFTDCPYPGRRLYIRQRLDLDDYPPRAVALPRGIVPIKRLAHAHCNRRHGALLRQALKRSGINRPSPTGATQQSRLSRW